MLKRRDFQKGSLGLISILLTFALIIFLLTSKHSPLPNNASKGDQFKQAIEGAKDVEKNLKKRDKLYMENMR